MNKTKEEIFTKEVSPTMEGLRQQLKDAGFLKHVHELMNRFADQETSHLTDQIKSMENYISDVDGQVKELRDENEIQGNYNDMLIKELESLQKENERLYDALSNIMNNERWLEMNIDTVNNLLSKHA